MTTETAPEAVEASANGVHDADPAETEAVAATALPEPDERETVPRFGDPRDAVVTIVRDRLERMLQPVDDDDVWHGVNVITAKDLDLATAEDLPRASIFAASVRTPAYIYVDAVCPVCGIAGSITLQVEAKLTAVQGSRKLALAAKATALPHVCGQGRLELGGPSRPAKGQTALDLGGEVDDEVLDADSDDGTDPTDDGDLEEQLEAALGPGGNPAPPTGFPEVDAGNGRELDADEDLRPAGEVNVDELRGEAERSTRKDPDDLSDLPF